MQQTENALEIAFQLRPASKASRTASVATCLLFAATLLSACEPAQTGTPGANARGDDSSSDIVDYDKGVAFLLKGSPDSYTDELQGINSYEALYRIDKWRVHEKSSISSDEALHTIVFVYNKPVPAGTSVITRHQFERWQGGSLEKLQPFVISQTVQEGQDIKPLVVLNETHAGGSGGYLNYTLEIDGTKIVHHRVRIGG